MSLKREVFLISAVAVLISAAWAQETENPKKLTARELFYAVADKKETPKPAAPKAAAAPKPVRKSVEKAAPPAAQVAQAERPAAPERRPNDMVQVAYRPHTGEPLGLRYTILKRSGSDKVEVSPDTVFRGGDKIQLSVRANVPGYLYIIAQGSSGTWKPMFPSAEVEDGNNHVEANRDYLMPPGSAITFVGEPGEEKLFIVLSRKPEPDLENMIYALKGDAKPTAAPAEIRPERPGTMMIASNININDSLVGRLRNAYARDLIIEKVDDEQPSAGSKKDKAIYAVNPSGSPDSRVVADLRLIHKQ